jgi:hypothetical protein
VQIDLTKATTAEANKQRKQIKMITIESLTTAEQQTASDIFTQWANENAAKIKLLAHLQTLTEAEKIALFNDVMA